ncbi:hypothetical protein M0M57_13345 [Flavobacterium azooxidireducens]|uniref:Thioredoxin domain-containing protein n=1 Tax=Flavobacterium azooxidireducens TaxID=1871076 RepID=A0ABY4KCT6_9FLAO|nr:hypothetical protein [Flavobacterium azooxidireducens]UPQ78601.1 hypothetical protein M0M57_13345 [Flavobacterium azooxidireducens]
MKKIILIYIIFLFSSCKINGSFQGLYSYYHKTIKENPNLVTKYNSETDCDLAIENKVISINHINLKKCLNQHSKALIYIWKPKCKSEFCYALNIIQDRCLKNNIVLYVVAEYYDSKLMSIDYNLKRSIYGIDVEYYNTNLTEKYLPLFINGLTTNESKIDNFIFFEDGKFKESFQKINKIDNL